MIYDRGPLRVYTRHGSPMNRHLQAHSAHYYAELQVYHNRFWESVQSGDRVDRLVQIPYAQSLTADFFAVPEDGHVYRINQAQQTRDDYDRPCTVLSLHREEANYDIERTDPDPERHHA